MRLPTAVGILFLVGLGIAHLGISVLNVGTIGWFFGPLESALRGVVPNPGPASVAFPLLLLGALLAALMVQRLVPDGLGSAQLPAPSFVIRPSTFHAVVLGIIVTALLYGRLATGSYSHFDVALFAVSLVAFGLAIHCAGATSRTPSGLARSDWMLAGWLGITAFGIHSIGLTQWNFAWVGDEGPFFAVAKNVAEGGPWKFFDLTVVYNAHPMLDSLMQGAFMRVFGTHIVGWRISESFIGALTTSLMYMVGKLYISRTVGVTSALVLASSHYIIAFERGAWNNTHILLFTTLSILLLGIAWKTQRPVFTFATGVSFGFCLYTFISAALIWPIVGLFLLTTIRPTRQQVAAVAVMGLGWLLVVTPALLTTPPSEMLQMTTLHTRREEALVDPVGVARANAVNSFQVFWTNPWWRHHYVGGPLVDPLTGVLLAAGLMIAVLRWPNRGARLAALWFVLGAALTGASNYVAQAPLTRLLFVMPAVALLAGLTVGGLEGLLHYSFGIPKRVATGSVIAATLALIPLNIHQLFVQSPRHLQSNGFIMTLKVLQENPDKTIVRVAPSNDGNFDMMLSWYPWLTNRFRWMNPNAVRDIESAAQDRDSVLFLALGDVPAIADSLEHQLAGRYRRVELWDPGRTYRVWVFAAT